MPKKLTYDQLEERVRELEQVEKKLLRSEQRYRFLIEATTAIDWTTDGSGGFIVPQPSWEKYTGQPWSEHKGFGWTKMIHPDDVDRILKVWEEACRTLSLYNTQGRVWNAASREFRDFEVRAVPIMDSDGTLCEWIGIILDVTDQKQAEAALVESELRLRQLAENLCEVFWVGSPDWDEIYYISPAYESIWGLSCQSLYDAPRSWLDLIIEEDRSAVVSAIPENLADKSVVMFPDYRIRRSDGAVRWISARAYPIENEAGEIYRVVGIAEDITERKRAENELAYEFQLRTKLLDNIPDCIALILRKGTREIVAGNKFASEAGITPGKTCHEACWLIDAPCSFCLAPELWETGKRQKVEVECNGQWYESVWMDLNEDLYVHYIVNITKHKAAEMALQESEARLKKMIRKSPLPMVIANEKQEIQFLNEKFTQLFGFTVDDLDTMERWWQSVYPEPGYRKTVRQAWERAFEDARAENIDIEMQQWKMTTKDGVLRNCEFHMVPMGGHRLVIIQDITEKQLNEERLRQAQRMESIGNLAGGIAHDFNNILSPIIGMSELLLEDLPPGSVTYDNAQEILNAGKRGSDLVKQILSFSRHAVHRKIPVEMPNILSEVIKLSRSTIPVSIDIVYDIQPDCGRVMADPTHIHQIAMNMITNAFHAVEEKEGKITLELQEAMLDAGDALERRLRPGRYARFSVSDDGHGIPAELLENIFEPYFTTKQMGKGTGLGLAVAYGLVKEHAGEIMVTSKVGHGSTFEVYLPVVDEAVKAAPADVLQKKEQGNEHILIVDDETPIVKLVRQMLARLGYRVTTCQASLEALDRFKAAPDAFDLVITDMAMPNMTGDQLTRKMLEVRSELPVIICTGYSERINEAKAMALGAKGFLMKPIVKTELVELVRKVLDAAQERSTR